MYHEEIVHHSSTDSPIAVREWMDVFKASMKISCRFERVLRRLLLAQVR